MEAKKTYTELMKLKTFKERFDYIKEDKRFIAADRTFGSDRYLNQMFYRSKAWKDVRNKVLIRDMGCDLGFEDRPIMRRAEVHHLNPVTKDDILNHNPDILNPEYLITVSDMTHKAARYGDDKQLVHDPIERKKNDQISWKSIIK